MHPLAVASRWFVATWNNFIYDSTCGQAFIHLQRCFINGVSVLACFRSYCLLLKHWPTLRGSAECTVLIAFPWVYLFRRRNLRFIVSGYRLSHGLLNEKVRSTGSMFSAFLNLYDTQSFYYKTMGKQKFQVKDKWIIWVEFYCLCRHSVGVSLKYWESAFYYLMISSFISLQRGAAFTQIKFKVFCFQTFLS